MKILKKLPLLPIACFPLLAAAVPSTEESLEHTRRQAELGNAAVQSFSGGKSFGADGNLTGIVINKFANEHMKRISFTIPVDLALKIQE